MNLWLSYFPKIRMLMITYKDKRKTDRRDNYDRRFFGDRRSVSLRDPGDEND